MKQDGRTYHLETVSGAIGAYTQTVLIVGGMDTAIYEITKGNNTLLRVFVLVGCGLLSVMFVIPMWWNWMRRMRAETKRQSGEAQTLRDEIVAEAAASGVTRIINPGTDLDRSRAAIALAEACKQARKQLPIQPKLSLLYAAIAAREAESLFLRHGHEASRHGWTSDTDPRSRDRLRADLVEGAFNALAADGLLAVRDAAAFACRREAIGRELFGEAMRRLGQAENILALVAEVRAKLESRLMGWARANLDDMRAQLDALAGPDFLLTTPAAALAEYPRWLKALALRADRAQRDPVKDQARMLEFKPFQDALAAADADAPEAQALRWELEELRVSLFAQELGVKGRVSAKRLAQRLQRLA